MERKLATKWRSVPPAPPRSGGSGFGGGGDDSWLTWFLVALHAVLVIALGVGSFYLARGAVERPLPFAVAVAGAGLALLDAWRRPWLSDEERFNQRPILGAIVGGIIGEAAHYALFGIPPSVPPGLLWVPLGAGGIGGAIGVAVGVYAILLVATARGVASIYREWRRSS